MLKKKITATLCCVLALFTFSGCSWVRSGNIPGNRDIPPQSVPDDGVFESINPFAMERTINACSVGSLLQFTATGITEKDDADDSVFASGIADLPDTELIEKELLALINSERVKVKGEGFALEIDDTMLWAARIRALELLDSFSHTRPNGAAYYTVFDEVDFSYAGKWHGENASTINFEKGLYDEKQIAGLMFEKLSASRGNYSNMLREQYGMAGVGVSLRTSPDGRLHVSSSQLYAGK